MENVKLFITQHGDLSVGIFPSYYTVECPFYKDEMDKELLDEFREKIRNTYAEFCDMKITAEYDFEIDNANYDF